ncbi:hypothetical protein VD0002_g728 [Verticillium dahliae]|uniref:M protein repeat protein n=1 Tax=Verticillium dahliae TaxID=27337 RepID=A0AA44WMT6_VERDA|nr:hypothetical protein EV126DRAFT_447818 [Verticillium dahliae]PNH34351.1 hypothetical protein BJF96_g2606 [Verticillium dahliae]PNH55023.1 hypothetical protein VD0003_g2577 [Verticillium dahliae]PNH69733.1 hypothetical protein VD0002_g728 [Verticillium dahliae]
MADDEKTKAEKLAAAKKRVEAMKKKKNKKAGSSKTKEEAEPAAAAEAEAAPAEEKPEEKADEAVEEKNEEAVEDTKPNTEEPSTEDRPASPSQAQPSLAQQSKLRSASFRKGSISTGVTGPLSPGPFSPDGESATDIYRKHVTRIEELEKENKRLAKDAAESEKRWKKAEEDLADLREEDGDASAKPPASDEQVDKLKSEIAALERQNSQLQQQVSRGTARHGSSPSSAAGSPPAVAELEARLIDKSATIETMELEISKLRAQLERSTSDREQIPALEERVARSEKAAGLAQRELADLRRNLDRTAEKAVREGSERTSAETKLRALEHDLADAIAGRLDAEKKADALEKKVATLTTLHKEQDARSQAMRRDKERAEREVLELKAKVETLDAEAARLRSRKSTDGGGGLDDDGVDELENEERLRLEKKVRDLESENHDLRRGLWQDKRRQLSGGQDVASPGGGGFQDVDLGGASPLAGRRHGQHGGGGLGEFFQSGINALTGHGGDEDGFLEDDDMDFDEDAFRQAQADDAKARLERIKDIKRGLKNWEGWRLDLVEIRRGGEEGHGEVFEV